MLWSEVLAYATIQGLESWECRAVMDMSKAYVREKSEGADNPMRIAPVDRGVMGDD